MKFFIGHGSTILFTCYTTILLFTVGADKLKVLGKEDKNSTAALNLKFQPLTGVKPPAFSLVVVEHIFSVLSDNTKNGGTCYNNSKSEMFVSPAKKPVSRSGSGLPP
ncbi:MAG: hypothetical protein ABFC57_08965 [Veillonellales bacterium]